MTDQAKFAQAVAEVGRLLAPVLENPDAVAADIMRHLVAEGWRPAAPRRDDPGRVDPDRIVTKDQAHSYAELARKGIEANRFRPEEGEGS